VSLDPKEVRELVDDLRVARRDLTESVNLLMKITDRIVAAILELIRAAK